MAWCIGRVLYDTREINCGSLWSEDTRAKAINQWPRWTDCELIRLITLLIKYSGPPKMYAVGTVLLFPSFKNDRRRKRKEKWRRTGDESNLINLLHKRILCHEWAEVNSTFKFKEENESACKVNVTSGEVKHKALNDVLNASHKLKAFRWGFRSLFCLTSKYPENDLQFYIQEFQMLRRFLIAENMKWMTWWSHTVKAFTQNRLLFYSVSHRLGKCHARNFSISINSPWFRSEYILP